MIFDPLDFIAKLASLVPKPKVNLTRFHGVFAPNSKHRTEVTPARSGKGRRKAIGQDKTPEESRSAMTGFCSCKTGIPSIHGHNLGTTIEKGIQFSCPRIKGFCTAKSSSRLCLNYRLLYNAFRRDGHGYHAYCTIISFK